MEWTNAEQVRALVLSGGFGFLLGVYYELFRLARLLFRFGKIGVFVQDVTFGITAALATFLFDLCLSGGMLRGYLFIGLAVGFAVYYFTIGQIVFTVSARLVRGIRKAVAAVTRPIGAAFQRIERGIAQTGANFVEKTRGLMRIFQKKS